jgi:hypothetical protein
MRVLVRDAETKQPLPGVQVTGWYARLLDWNPPERPRGVTGADGIASLQVGPRAFWLRAEVDGYLAADHGFLDAGDILPESPRPDRTDYVFELITGPRPNFVLIVPEGYTGPVVLRLVSGDVPVPRGQRTFEVPVDRKGKARACLPGWMIRDQQRSDVSARYADGKAIPEESGERETGVRFRWAAPDVYHVGTRQDYDDLHDRLYPREGGDGSASRDFDPAVHRRLTAD